MYKVGLILLLFYIFSAGCAVRNIDLPEIAGETRVSSERILGQVAARNITNGGFFVQKGKISTSGEAGRINLLFTMKYVKPGNYLISLRSITGIEAFRVYISQDTVLINDRLNQEILYGKPADFERITGIHPDLLRISLGDIVFTGNEIVDVGGCSGGEIKLEGNYKGLLINTIVSCGVEKVKSAVLNRGIPDRTINIDYKKHRFDYYRIPRRIEVNDYSRNVTIKVKIEKYLSPWVGDVEFIPGNGYSIKSLI